MFFSLLSPSAKFIEKVQFKMSIKTHISLLNFWLRPLLTFSSHVNVFELGVGVDADGCVDGGCSVTELKVRVCLNWGPLGEKGFEVSQTWDKRKL